jgi:hypothetical protein
MDYMNSVGVYVGYAMRQENWNGLSWRVGMEEIETSSIYEMRLACENTPTGASSVFPFSSG